MVRSPTFQEMSSRADGWCRPALRGAGSLLFCTFRAGVLARQLLALAWVALALTFLALAAAGLWAG
jgi:hypothetical protein